MDIVALEFVTAVAIAREQTEIGTDLVAMEDALRDLRHIEPGHEVLAKLETRIARHRSGGPATAEKYRLRACARRWDLD